MKTGNIQVGGSLTANSALYTMLTSSGVISSSGNTITANITSSGNISSSGGTVQASNYTQGNTALTTTFTELNYLDGLTSGEATQILAIGSNAISNTEWSYVATMQDISTGAIPTIAGLTVTKVALGSAGEYGGNMTANGKSGKFDILNIPTIVGKSSGRPAHSTPTLIKNSSVDENSVILITCATSQLSANAFGVKLAATAGTNGYYISLTNEVDEDFTATSASFNAVII